MLNVLLVVWRECFEAALIVGILAAVAKKQSGNAGTQITLAVRWGIALGVFLAVCVGAAIQLAQSELQGLVLEHFQTALIAIAAALMVHMCFWMHSHGRTLKKEMENSVAAATKLESTQKTFATVLFISALAVAREGAEIVLFLYGMGVEAGQNSQLTSLVGFAFAGFLLAFATYFAFQKSLLFFSQKTFFRVTEIAMLVTALSMILSVVRRLVSNGVLNPISSQVWDSSFLLDENSTIGSFVSMLTGYESKPSLLVVLTCVVFVLGVFAFYAKKSPSFSR